MTNWPTNHCTYRKPVCHSDNQQYRFLVLPQLKIKMRLMFEVNKRKVKRQQLLELQVLWSISYNCQAPQSSIKLCCTDGTECFSHTYAWASFGFNSNSISLFSYLLLCPILIRNVKLDFTILYFYPSTLYCCWYTDIKKLNIYLKLNK